MSSVLPVPLSANGLWARLFTPDCPDLIDVCLPVDADALGRRLPNSLRMPHTQKASANAAVFICHRGKKLSQGAAAMMEVEGKSASFLIGGSAAWTEGGFPTVLDAALARNGRYVCTPASFSEACALRWIVERLLPPGSVLMTVDPAVIADVAVQFDARPLSDPFAALEYFGIVSDTLQDVLTTMMAPNGEIAHLLNGCAIRHGTGVISQSAAANLFDMCMIGSLT